MLKNYFISIMRGIRKQKIYFLINTLGLTLGVTCAVIIFMIVTFELSFNNFHKDIQNIYRIVTEENRTIETHYTPGVPYELPQALEIDYPELEAVTTVDFNFGEIQITVAGENGNEQRFLESDVAAFVNPGFWKIFKYDWVSGSPEILKDRKNIIVLSESYAKKYFGNRNPVGKTFKVNVNKVYEVAGVVKDPPKNSDFPIHLIMPIEGPRNTPGWGSVSSAVQCFIRVPDNFNTASFETSLTDFLKKHMDKEDYERKKMILQPMDEIHFDNKYSNIANTIFTKDKITTLSLVGIMLLIISCINFINLKTALTSIYFKEIGIRKVLGSSRTQIALRFFGETFILVVLSIIISIVLLEILLPQLEFFTGYSLGLAQIGTAKIIFFLIAVAFITSLLAGLYPSLFISSLQPEKALKANINTSTGSIPVRKILVVFQFVVSEVLIIGTLVVYNQLSYLQNVDMGFDKSSLLEISLPDNDDNIIKRFKDQLLLNSSIENVSYSNTGTASQNTWGGDAIIFQESQEMKFNSQIKFTDADFFDTYKIELLAGENFNKNSTDTTYIVNQTFVQRMGLKKDYLSVIGTDISIWGKKGRVIGVVKDFNTTSLVDDVPPVIITTYRHLYSLAGIRINTSDIKSTVKYVEDIFENVYPDFVIDYEFLDKSIEHFYEDEILFSRLMITFSLISVFIGCMGIFGLSAFLALNRTKEIGIRKVLGASSASIVKLLSKDFLKLVLVASIVACPVAYYFMQKWIEDFAFRISLDWYLFFTGVIITIIIALLAVSYNAIKAAVVNPVKSLKYE